MQLYVDGGCSGNDQLDLAKRKMVSVVTDSYGGLLKERIETGGSNNIAELLAVYDALEWCHAHKVLAVEVMTDSRNNLSWVFGKKVGKHINDRERVLSLKRDIELLRQTIALTLTWLPRDENLAGHYIESRYGL